MELNLILKKKGIKIMSIEHFTGTVWSESLLKSLNEKYVGVANCFRDFEGEIKEKGSVVRMCGITGVNVSTYKPNTDMNDPQTLTSFSRDIAIDQAKYFNFQIDDVDRAQAVPKVMDLALQTAAESLAKTADNYVYSLWSKADSKNVISDTDVSSYDILGRFLNIRQKLMEAGVSDPNDIVIEVSPAIAKMILEAKMTSASENTPYLDSGAIGSIFGCKVFVSNNVHVEQIDNTAYHYCFIRTKRAIAFAEQISNVVAYSPEKRFCDAVKGLHLYGANVIYPQEFYVFKVPVYN